MPSELRRILTVLVLLAATLAGQPRWLDETRSEDAPERAWQRSLSPSLAAEGQDAKQGQVSAVALHRRPALRPPVQARPLEHHAGKGPAVLRGAGAPRAPDHLSAA